MSVTVMWLLLDGKKGLVYQRPRNHRGFSRDTITIPTPQMLDRDILFSAELYRHRSTCFVGWTNFLNTVQLFQTQVEPFSLRNY
jgi:hypothetical protein